MEKSRLSAKAPPTFIINNLTDANIKMYKPMQKGNRLEFFIDKKQKKDALAVCGKKNVECDVTGESGVKTDAKRLFMRFGMWLGIVLGLVVIFVYSTMLTRIRINGADRVEHQAIVDAVGISLPAVFAHPDTKDLQKRIVDINGISGVSVQRRGTVLDITVIETLPDTEIIDTTTPAPLVAKEDCVILSVVVLQGTAMVKAGDTVRKGSVLIDAYVTDLEGNKAAVRAMGEVKATVYFQRHTYYPDKIISKVRTGETECRTTIELPLLKYEKPPSFVSYDTETSQIRCVNILPFTLVKTTYYQTSEKETDFCFDANKSALIQENLCTLQASLPTDATPIKWWYLVKRLDKNTILSIYYQVECYVAVRP